MVSAPLWLKSQFSAPSVKLFISFFLPIPMFLSQPSSYHFSSLAPSLEFSLCFFFLCLFFFCIFLFHIFIYLLIWYSFFLITFLSCFHLSRLRLPFQFLWITYRNCRLFFNGNKIIALKKRNFILLNAFLAHLHVSIGIDWFMQNVLLPPPPAVYLKFWLPSLDLSHFLPIVFLSVLTSSVSVFPTFLSYGLYATDLWP